MTWNDNSLPEEEQELAKARDYADTVVSSALNWIQRYHAKVDDALVGRLFTLIRELIRAMQNRRIDDIKRCVEDLLGIQTQLSLPPLGQHPMSSEETAEETAWGGLPEVFRVHPPWRKSDYFMRGQHLEEPAHHGAGSVFVSYARADAVWLRRVKVHFRPLERMDRLRLWHDGVLQPGRDWLEEIKAALSEATAAILLLSANFMASDFICQFELPRLTQRAIQGQVVVFPLMVGHCLFEEDDLLRNLQMFNDPEMPLSRLAEADVDRTLVSLAKSVRDLLTGRTAA